MLLNCIANITNKRFINKKKPSPVSYIVHNDIVGACSHHWLQASRVGLHMMLWHI